MTLAAKPDSFDMLSRVGRQIDIRLNSRSVLHTLAVPNKRSKCRVRPKGHKLLPPSALIARLDEQEAAAQPLPPAAAVSCKSEEDFVFMRQSRTDFYKVQGN